VAGDGQENVSAMRASARLLAQNDQNNQHNDPTGHRDIQPGHACKTPVYRLEDRLSIGLLFSRHLTQQISGQPVFLPFS
jgi:hypothetical protein